MAQHKLYEKYVNNPNTESGYFTQDVIKAKAGKDENVSIQTEIKKGESNLPDNKDGGEKTLNVSSNNGDVNITFVSESF